MSGKIKNAFSEIHADENLKMQTFENITAKKPTKRIPLAAKLAPAMAVFALFIFGNIYFTPVSFISIDINPSIELSVNAFDRVINVTASNEDGENIINAVNLTNLNYIEALETLNSTESFRDFTDSYTEITVISDNSNEIINSIENCTFNNQNMSFHSTNPELKEQALENNISFGKYRAYLELLEVNPSVEIEDVANLPMGTIRDMIENDGALSSDAPSQGSGAQSNHGNNSNGSNDGNQNHENGNGHQYGKDN